jgi:L-threonylcarbamoyladenylate synthase
MSSLPPSAKEGATPAAGQPQPDPVRATVPADAEHIARAAELFRQGRLVAFPTETVYGLGADAANAGALALLYKTKGRPHDHPVIVHISGADRLESWAREVPDAARLLAARFWPGPLTLVLKRAPGVSDALTGGQDTVGLRVPAHPVAQALLAAFGGGVAAPSANRFGRVSPTAAEHVRVDLGNDVDLILDGGACEVGIESTILDLSRGQPVLLRPGRVSAEDIAKAIGAEPQTPDAEAPRAPGGLQAHYAPRAKLRLMKRVAMLEALSTHKGRRLAALAIEVSVPRLAPPLLIVVPAVAAVYARSLYANLRALDATGCDEILVEEPPQSARWDGVRDRLARASAA